MKALNTLGAPGGAPFALCLLLACMPALAQDPDSGSATDEELAPIDLGESPHVSDPVLDPSFDPDAADLPGELPPPVETPREQLSRLFQLYRDAVNDGMFSEADTLAKRIVELTIRINGRDSGETARAITNLAIAQHGSGDYESALLNFDSAIDILERTSDRLNADLINPLKGKAASQLALGRPSQATETYDRAVHISHVNFGPHNLEQIEMLESLAETYLAGGAHDEAVDIQERIFALQARNVPQDSVELLPALRTQARWLHRLQLFDRERYTWRRVISILEDTRGKEDLSLIPPLTKLGMSYLYWSPQEIGYSQPISNTTGEIYLKRALRIAEDSPDADWLTRSESMVALADYYILSDRPSRAERMYNDAWELMSGSEERERVREDRLQSLLFLNEARPPRFYGIEGTGILPAKPKGFETGKVVYTYSLSSTGRPRDLELVTAQPQGFEDMERSVERELRRAVQRPRVVEGRTVDTDDLTFSHDFYYRPSDLPETVTAADESR